MQLITLRRLYKVSLRSRCYSSAIDKPVIGFIGMGLMGYEMASNLSKSSLAHKLVPFDIQQAQTSTFMQNHPNNQSIMQPPSSVKDLVKHCNVIITMLPTPGIVKQVYMNEIKPFVNPNTILIDSSTIDPGTSKDIALQFKDTKVHVLDAPVSGGVVGAKNATLTFMVGGEAKSLELATPILKTMGKNIVHCGGNGNGQIAKICNNMILGSTMVALSESLVLGERLGLDPKILNSIINTSSGRCWSSDTYNPVPGYLQNVPSSRQYVDGFSVALQQKDLGLALAAAESVKVPVPMAATADNVYKTMMSQPKLNKLDMSVVYQWLLGNWNKFVQ